MEVKLKLSAQKQLDKISDKLASKIAGEIVELASDPFPLNSKKLVGWHNQYRLRMGDYRIIYVVDKENKEIVVTEVVLRKDAYR